MSGLVKAKKYDWKDSNMALIGTDTDRGVKKESAETEKAWNCVAMNKETKVRFIWRIEKFKVVPWPQEDYGEFYDGDSYIIYNKRPNPENPDDILQDIHFWIGCNSTQDEYGTAAYKTVELDTLLDDAPIQHREVQDHESELFKSYFPHRTILKGGCATGFRHVAPEEYETRLLHFHGEKNKVCIREIPCLKACIDSGDVYILDNGLEVFQFNGEKCNKDEKFRAVQYLQNLKSQRHGKAKVESLDEDDIDESHQFFTKLGDGQPSEEDVEEVSEVRSRGVKKEKSEKVLFSLSDKSGKMTFTEIGRGEISKRSLDSSDVFILDTGEDCFVWVGKDASSDEKKNGIIYAHKYLQGTDHPLIAISVLKESKESPEFLQNLC